MAESPSSASNGPSTLPASDEGFPPPPKTMAMMTTLKNDDVILPSDQSGIDGRTSRDPTADARRPLAPGRRPSTTSDKPLGTSPHPATTLESVEDWLGGDVGVDSTANTSCAVSADSVVTSGEIPSHEHFIQTASTINGINSEENTKDSRQMELENKKAGDPADVSASGAPSAESLVGDGGADSSFRDEEFDRREINKRSTVEGSSLATTASENIDISGVVSENDVLDAKRSNEDSMDAEASSGATSATSGTQRPETVAVGEREYELMLMRKLVREMMSDLYKSANWPFLDPVDVEALKLWDYPERVKNPIWLKKSEWFSIADIFRSYLHDIVAPSTSCSAKINVRG